VARLLLLVNPIGMIAGAVIGGVYVYNIHKYKGKTPISDAILSPATLSLTVVIF
jgi:hypothetical protein